MLVLFASYAFVCLDISNNCTLAHFGALGTFRHVASPQQVALHCRLILWSKREETDHKLEKTFLKTCESVKKCVQVVKRDVFTPKHLIEWPRGPGAALGGIRANISQIL